MRRRACATAPGSRRRDLIAGASPAPRVDQRRQALRILVLVVAFFSAVFASACSTTSGEGGSQRTVTIDPETARPPEGDGDAESVSSLAESDCENRDLRPDENNLSTVEAATLCLVNAERRARDRPALRNDSQLAEAAERKSEHMVRESYFAHVGPDDRNVVDWARDSGYVPGRGDFEVGENLGWASEGGATPEMIVLGWMRSPGHRRNLLAERFRDSGIGVVLGAPRPEGGGGATYTHMLGAKG